MIKSAKGFSLIELLIVLAIVGMIIAVAVPQVTKAFRVGLKSVSNQVGGAFSFAYETAIIKQRVLRFVFDLDKNIYRLEICNVDNFMPSMIGDSSLFSPYRGELGKDKKTESGIIIHSVKYQGVSEVINSGMTFVYFFPQGVSDGVIVTFKGKSTEESFYSIILNPINGKFKIEGKNVTYQDLQ